MPQMNNGLHLATTWNHTKHHESLRVKSFSGELEGLSILVISRHSTSVAATDPARSCFVVSGQHHDIAQTLSPWSLKSPLSCQQPRVQVLLSKIKQGDSKSKYSCWCSLHLVVAYHFHALTNLHFAFTSIQCCKSANPPDTRYLWRPPLKTWLEKDLSCQDAAWNAFLMNSWKRLAYCTWKSPRYTRRYGRVFLCKCFVRSMTKSNRNFSVIKFAFEAWLMLSWKSQCAATVLSPAILQTPDTILLLLYESRYVKITKNITNIYRN